MPLSSTLASISLQHDRPFGGLSARRLTLAALPATEVVRACGSRDGRRDATSLRILAGTQPVLTVSGAVGWTPTNRDLLRWAGEIGNVMAAWLASGDDRYPAAIVASLRRWADADALRPGGGNPTNIHLNLETPLIPVMLAWSEIRHEYRSLKPDDHQAIEAWLARVAARHWAGLDWPRDRWNNHFSSGFAFDALWAVLSGDSALFRNAVAGYLDQIGRIRADGSFPLEAARGRMALTYTSRNLAHLVLIAELASHQGSALYDQAVGERSLHDAVSFFVRATEDPLLILGYAQANEHVPERYRLRPGDPLAGSLQWPEETAWTSYYVRRFPDHPNTRAIRRLFTAEAPQLSPLVGGNPSCLIGPI